MFVLISMLASAFLAHYNAPKFYGELEAPADGSSKLPRFNLVVGLGFLAAAGVMGAVMAGGFLTFGSASQGLILNSYATSDPLAFLARLGIGMRTPVAHLPPQRPPASFFTPVCPPATQDAAVHRANATPPLAQECRSSSPTL